jgi:glutamine amidotransferase
VGDPDHANTHPFRHGPALLVHNGHVPAFDRVRPRLLDRLDEERRRSVRGTTDSEHVLALLLQLRDEAPDAPLHDVTREAVHLVQDWVGYEDEGATVRATDADFSSLAHDELETVLGLNLLWTDGDTLGGSRLNRTLWARRRDRVHTCSICGHAHADPPPDADYRAVTLASERLTDEDWTEVPNGSVFHVDETGSLCFEALAPA